LLAGLPDVYSSVSIAAMHTLEKEGHIDSDNYQPYLHNRLVLMVPQGNPAGIGKVEDLGRARVRVSQPDPRFEDIAQHIQEMYRLAGGEALERRIMIDKRRGGSTRFTVVHHRETPARLLNGEADVGPVWATEAAYAKKRGWALEIVEPGDAIDGRNRITYYICSLPKGRNLQNGQKFVAFVLSPGGQRIFAKHGFYPATAIPS
jgi:ABC-type molybdate transport system substrate-binding protein